MCQHQLQLRSLSLSHNILTQPLLISTVVNSQNIWKVRQSSHCVQYCATPHLSISCSILLSEAHSRFPNWTLCISSWFQFSVGKQDDIPWPASPSTERDTQWARLGRDRTRPNTPARHTQHSTLYLPLSSPRISTPLLLKIKYFWYIHKQRITVSQMLSFLNWIFLSTAQKCNCVRPAQGSLCWLDMRRLRNRAEQGFSISTERNKYSHSVSQGPLTAYTTTRCIRTCWGHSFTDALFENGVQSNAYFLQKINLIHRAMKIPSFWQLRCLAEERKIISAYIMSKKCK